MIMDSVILYRDVLVIHCFGEFILVGIGNQLRIHDASTLEFVTKISLSEMDAIHGIVEGANKIAVFGGRSLSIIEIEVIEKVIKIHKIFDYSFKDWIITIEFFTNTVDDIVCILFAHNYAQKFNLSTNNHEIITCQESCILYGGCLLPENPNEMVVFSGTVFREILIWKFTKTELTDLPILHRLKGHKGVIFSIFYDPIHKLISSTSDDRTVRLWQIRKKSEKQVAIDWAVDQIDLKITMFGHTARVWKSLIVGEHILSIGEDSTVCVWSLEGKLKKKMIAHAGGTVRSVAVSEDESTIFTGGSDGAINTWPFDTGEETEFRPLKLCSSNNAPKFVGYLSSGTLFVFFDGGEIHFYKAGCNEPTGFLKLSECEGHCILKISPEREYVALASKNGYLRIFQEDSVGELNLGRMSGEKTMESKILSVQWLDNDRLLVCEAQGVIKIMQIEDNTLEILGEFQLPPSRERWTTSAIIVRNLLICGDRSGSVFIFDIHEDKEKNPRQVFPKMHGRFGVQSFDVLGERMISTGRDGTLRYYKICRDVPDSPDYMKMLHVKKIPMEWGSKMYITEKDIYILGFQEIEFMLYSTRLDRVILRIACGGGHRSWDFNIKDDNVNFVCIRDKQVQMIENRSCLSSTSVIPGYHTKIIHTLEVLTFFKNRWIFVSGGEDCTIRISILDRSEEGRFSFLPLGIYDGHISNIITIAVFELKKTLHTLRNLVFSGGGRAQLKVWEVTMKTEQNQFNSDDIDMTEVATFMLQGTDKDRRKTSHNQKQSYSINPETRFMNIKLHSCPEIPNLVILFVACSDGFVRILTYNIKTKTIILATEIPYHNRCIIKIHTLMHADELILMTMATDGKVNFWQVNPTINQISRQKKDLFFFENPVKQPFSVFEAHQSGINSYDLMRTPKGGYLFFSGGDDNKSSLWSFRIDLIGPGQLEIKSVSRWSSGAIHSGQITGVRFIGNDRLLSVSLDQKIVMLHYDFYGEALNVLPIREKMIFVPDVQGLTLCRSLERYSVETIVCGYGQGLEVMYSRS